jgi:hypothetical protein
MDSARGAAVAAWLRVLGICSGVAASACGGGHNDITIPDDDDDDDNGFEGPDGGPPDAGMVPDAPMDPQGPVVEIVSPIEPAAGDYGGDAIVTSARVRVLCRVERNANTGDPVDSSSVRLAAIAGSELIEVDGIPSGIADEYTGTIDVGELENGAVAFRCSASDLAAEPRSNSDEMDTFVDLGPRVEVFSPSPGASFGQQVDVSFQVVASPVATDDSGAAVDEVVLLVGSTPIEVAPMGGGNYFASVVFDDPVFDPALDGPISLTVRATNARTGAPVTRSEQVSFVADTDGPTIAISEPSPGELVGGFMAIAVTVSDPAEVDSVVATIAHQHEIELVRGSGDQFTATFDTRLLDDSWVFPLLEVRSRDAVGNEAAVGRVVSLDNRAPLVSMDSPLMREALCPDPSGSCDAGDSVACSLIFDPLGSDAADDGEVVGALIELRARAEDRGNGALAPSGVFTPLAGVDPAEVELFVLDDTTLPLIVDTDGDGVCDAVNPELVPTSVPQAADEAAVVSLVPVDPQGSAFFAAPTDPNGVTPGLDDSTCSSPPVDGDQPVALCMTTPLTRVIATQTVEQSAVFTVPPVDDAFQCLGNAFDAPGTNIADGWMCAVGVARDGLGNQGLSPPLRLCVDSDGNRLDGAGVLLENLGCGVGGDGEVDFGDIATLGNRPACSDGCTPPVSFANLPTMQLRVRPGGDAQCGDGIDNDLDGDVDTEDSGCTGPDDAFED